MGVSRRRVAGVVLGGGMMLAAAAGQTLAPVCRPRVSEQTTVATAAQRRAAGNRAEPPVTDTSNGFAWPDSTLGVIKVNGGYEFFASDGGLHADSRYGAIVRVNGSLDNPLGSGNPQDVTVSANPNASVNPNYSSYTYMGGGPVFQVPDGMTGAGNLLATYHAELPNDALYSALGLAASKDNGEHWTDLGEIIRLNQSYSVGLDGFDIGDGPLVLSPDRKYFYLYFPDWSPNGTLHTTTAAGVTTTTKVSVARAPVAAVLAAAFGSMRPFPVEPAFHAEQPHMVPFEKFYEGTWNLQPGIGGGSTDLIPKSSYNGYLDIHYNPELKRYVMILSNDTVFGYAESVDGLKWTIPTLLGNFETIAAYPAAVGLGDDPRLLGKRFYVYFTHLPTDGSGWSGGELRRITVTCQ